MLPITVWQKSRDGETLKNICIFIL